jgi:hypothetical protein
MHLRKLLLAVTAVTVVALATFSGGLMGQGLVDGIKVTLPHPVTIDDRVLDPGEYEIRRVSMHQDNALRIFNKDKMVYETNVLTIPAEAKETPEETKVILHHIGDRYYFDKIWMHGKDYAYEFVLPERVRAEQRELALTVPARFESTQVAQVEEPQIGLANQLDALAVQQDREPQIGLANQLDALAAQQDRDQQAAALAESERLAAIDSERQVRERQAEFDQQAALQPEPALATEESEVRSESIERESPTQLAAVQEAEELPATSTNWLAFLAGGVLLLMLSLFLRPAHAQE